MTGTLPRLSQSKPKTVFFRYLGWSENDERHKRLYGLIMEEAAQGRARTCQHRENLTPQTRADPHVTAPYSSAMITETARHHEVKYIYECASPETRVIYDRGVMQDGANWDNWIIRWCLWHVFRYRDDRNRNRSGGNRNTCHDLQYNGVVEEAVPSGYYDPVYDIHRR
ncbi:hypothetical protein EJ08DRAFT_457785 [Tothia fuscella]|uniref:Uncharacterized protein n=1 Tax=Tothia fuscella TaxID=1048955 RepID=A0A9P4NIZ9_9PEZI|nr:hypothetical protein EJ08DRAFT_457785 [Tothia fuscella]